MKRWNCGKLNRNWCVQACIEQAKLKCCPKHGCPSRCSKLYCRSIYNLKSPDRCYSMLHGTQIAQRCNNILIFYLQIFTKGQRFVHENFIVSKSFFFCNLHRYYILFLYSISCVVGKEVEVKKESTILLSNFINKQFYLNNG